MASAGDKSRWKLCLHCRASNARKRCRGCNGPYCSPECQKLDWTLGAHRSVCGIISLAETRLDLGTLQYLSTLAKWYLNVPIDLPPARVGDAEEGLFAAAAIRAGQPVALFPLDSFFGLPGRWPQPASAREAAVMRQHVYTCDKNTQVATFPARERPRFLAPFSQDAAAIDTAKLGPPPASWEPEGAAPWFRSWPAAAWEEVYRYLSQSCSRANAVGTNGAPLFLVATRNIAAGEEICYSYSPMYWIERGYEQVANGASWHSELLLHLAAWADRTGRSLAFLQRQCRAETRGVRARERRRKGRPRTVEELTSLVAESLSVQPAQIEAAVRAKSSERP